MVQELSAMIFGPVQVNRASNKISWIEEDSMQAYLQCFSGHWLSVEFGGKGLNEEKPSTESSFPISK